MKKRLIYFRHGIKDGENISASQIAEIEENGIFWINNLIKGEKVVIHLGSAFERTSQTIRAWEKYADSNHLYSFYGYLPSDARFGNEKMFAKFMENPEIVAEAKVSTWFAAYEKFDPTFIIEVQSEMFAALREMFASVPDGITIVSVGHTPIIEWLAFRIDKHAHISRDIKLNELTGFVFTEESRQILVTDTIGF